ncbi:conserved domain protein [Bacteroides ovatus SD CMC 3f]|nr:conserved domain protein [Bacteroides ovatus SD CMC 3f]
MNKGPFFAIYAKKRKSDLSGYYLIVISICIFLGISSTPYFFLNIALALCTEVSLEGLRLDTIIAFF